MQVCQYTYRTKVYKGKSMLRFYAANEFAKESVPSFDMAMPKNTPDLQFYTAILKKLCLLYNLEDSKEDIYFELTDKQSRIFLVSYAVCSKDSILALLDEKVDIFFCAEPTLITDGETIDIDFSFSTLDITAIRDYLAVKTRGGYRTLKTSPTSSTRIRMANWYGRELATELREAGQAEIDKFVYETAFEPEIKDFIIVPQYNVHKYIQGTKLLSFNYSPEVLLPLALSHNNTNYTIIVPICEKMTRNKMRHVNTHSKTTKDNSQVRNTDDASVGQ